MKEHNGMRPHDIVVLLKIMLMNDGWLHKDLASSLRISNSEISESLNRSVKGRLLAPDKKTVFKSALLNFVLHGLKHVFPVEPGQIVKGLPTAHSAPVLKNYFLFDDYYVWPSPEGSVKGQAISPLYPNQAWAAGHDPKLYEQLALIDALRVGKARERQKAEELLKEYLQPQTYAREYSQDQGR